MLTRFKEWLEWFLVGDDARASDIEREDQAATARLDEMKADIDRLTLEEWWAKWRPDKRMP